MEDILAGILFYRVHLVTQRNPFRNNFTTTTKEGLLIEVIIQLYFSALIIASIIFIQPLLNIHYNLSCTINRATPRYNRGLSSTTFVL